MQLKAPDRFFLHDGRLPFDKTGFPFSRTGFTLVACHIGVAMHQPAVLLLCLVALAACAPFPQIDTMAPGTADPPPLLPIDELIAQAGAATPDPGPALAARAARLKARAAGLDTPPAP